MLPLLWAMPLLMSLDFPYKMDMLMVDTKDPGLDLPDMQKIDKNYQLDLYLLIDATAHCSKLYI